MIWVSVAFASITLTLLFSWKLEGSAATINTAGSLRMQAFRLAAMINDKQSNPAIYERIQNFDQTIELIRKGDPKRPLILPSADTVQHHMNMVEAEWNTVIRPSLLRSLFAVQHRVNLNDIQSFINKIDQLVLSIEAVDDSYTNWLKVFQTSLLVLVIFGACIMVILLYLWILRPLKHLQKGVNEVHEGKFGTQVPIASSSEFALVDQGFNQMSEHLLKLYSNLEQEVNQKTQDLAQKNETLLTLYKFSSYFNERRDIIETCQGFLSQISEIFPKVIASSIRLLDQKSQKANLIAYHNLPEELHNAINCKHLGTCLCGNSYLTKNWIPIHLEHNPNATPPVCHELSFQAVHNIPIRYKDDDIAYLTLFFKETDDMNDTNLELLVTLCNQLGIVISNNQLIQESQQFAVLQERNLIAQGLHDSIAQTLNFLNLQTQMLEDALRNHDAQQIQENLNFIQEGIKECYDDVRELLMNFRTRITNKDFDKAIESLVQRFEQQTHIPIHTHWKGNGVALTGEQQLQFLFILQESLSNIRKHSQASEVHISFDNYADYIMRIRDNGIGFEVEHLNQLHGSHVGLKIMSERAKRIHAQLDIQSKPHEFTEITLTLPSSERTIS